MGKLAQFFQVAEYISILAIRSRTHLFIVLTLSPPESVMETFKVVLTFESVNHGVTIQMKPLQQYFHMALPNKGN